jgi:hypothetical protein
MKIWRMHILHWTPKATNTRSEYVIFMLFHCSNVCTKAPLRYVIPLLFSLFILCSYNLEVLRCCRGRDTLPGSTIRGVVNVCNTKRFMLCRNRLLEYVWLCVLQNCYVIGNVKNFLASRPPRSCRQLQNKPHCLACLRATHTCILKQQNLSINQII